MKHMNMKRFTSAAMAGALALSMSAPAFAASTNTTPNSTVITGAYEEIPISVVVPETGTAQINPYGLPVSITKSDDTIVNIVDQKITTQFLSIKNQGSVPLDVDASLSVTPKGGVTIAANKDTNKAIKVELEVAGLNDSNLAVSSEDETLDDKLIDKFVADSTWTGANKLAAPVANTPNTAPAGPTKSTDTGNTSPMATLGAATVADDAVTYGAKSIALFRLSGDLAQDPKNGSGAANPWAAEDGFTATVVFSFAPAAKTLITAGSHTGTLTNVSIPTKAYPDDTVTFTFEAAAGKTNCTAAITGYKGTTAPTVTITEDPANAGHYTGTFTMCEASAAAGITLTITVPA